MNGDGVCADKTQGLIDFLVVFSWLLLFCIQEGFCVCVSCV